MDNDIITIKATKDKWAHLLDLIDLAATSQNNNLLAEKLINISYEIIGKNLKQKDDDKIKE